MGPLAALCAQSISRRVVLIASGLAICLAPPDATGRAVLPAEQFVRAPPDFGSFRIGSKVKELANRPYSGTARRRRGANAPSGYFWSVRAARSCTGSLERARYLHARRQGL